MRYVILSDFQMSFPQKVKSYPHYPHKISTSCEYLMWIMWITFLVFYFFKGSFDGKPAFLGYFPAVFLTFLIFTSDLPMSVPGNWNLSTSVIFPPSTFTANSASLISSSESPLL